MYVETFTNQVPVICNKLRQSLSVFHGCCFVDELRQQHFQHSCFITPYLETCFLVKQPEFLNKFEWCDFNFSTVVKSFSLPPFNSVLSK